MQSLQNCRKDWSLRQLCRVCRTVEKTGPYDSYAEFAELSKRLVPTTAMQSLQTVEKTGPYDSYAEFCRTVEKTGPYDSYAEFAEL